MSCVTPLCVVMSPERTFHAVMSLWSNGRSGSVTAARSPFAMYAMSAWVPYFSCFAPLCVCSLFKRVTTWVMMSSAVSVMESDAAIRSRPLTTL